MASNTMADSPVLSVWLHMFRNCMVVSRLQSVWHHMARNPMVADFAEDG